MEHRKAIRIVMRRMALLIAALLLLAPLTGCTTNPATGRKQWNLLSTATEIQMGLEAKPTLIHEYGGEIDSIAFKQYVDEIGHRLAAVTEGVGPDLPWSFTVLDSDVINAFALPGGQVFISRGLVGMLSNEAQLAGVLGHEIGHVLAEHADEQISRRLVFAGILTVAVSVSSSADDDAVREGIPLLVGVGGQGFLLRFSRDHEFEADKLGVRYMVKLGYDPIGQLQVMRILKQAMGSNRPPEFLSTHPYPEHRIERIRRMLKNKYAYTQNNQNFGLFEARFQVKARQAGLAGASNQMMGPMPGD
ncbi:MAG: M48 family metallopeptidase [Phycisphaerales bacterium]|nr:M48 family metallopeptidase [Phycisphaerales bacterium]